MSSSINWMGNRVFEPGTPRQAASPIAATNTAQGGSVQTPSTAQGGSVQMPSTTQQEISVTPETQQGPPPSTERGYIPYYLAGLIGRNVRAEFIIGSNQYVDKTGVMSEVGINYFVLRDVNSRTDIMCDLYSVKFVTSL